MGNRVVQYFLAWLQRRGEQNWIDKHIHALLAVGAPFLGSPKSLRTVLLGDTMGLEMFVTREEAMYMARVSASLPWLFPILEDAYPDVFVRFSNSGGGGVVGASGGEAAKGVMGGKAGIMSWSSSVSVGHLTSTAALDCDKSIVSSPKRLDLDGDDDKHKHNSTNSMSSTSNDDKIAASKRAHMPNNVSFTSSLSKLPFHPVPFTECLSLFVPKSQHFFEKFYLNNPNYLQQQPRDELAPVLCAPPLKRIWVLNGINRFTEVGYYLQKGGKNRSGFFFFFFKRIVNFFSSLSLFLTDWLWTLVQTGTVARNSQD